MAYQSLRSLPNDAREQRETPSEQPVAPTADDAHRFERGQTLVEYALIIALVAIVVIAALYLLAPTIADTFNHISNTL